MSTKDKRISFEEKGRYPFTTPEGYFDDLTARIMEQIPDNTAKDNLTACAVSQPRHRQLWSNITTVAASLVLIAMVAARLLSAPDSPKQSAQSDAQQISTEDYNEELMNYAMMDNMDVYCYLSGEGDE